MEKQSILDMCMGAIKERVDYEVGRVLDNILDVNTKATAKRKIAVTLELAPDDERRSIRVNVIAKSVLVPTNAITTSLYVTGAPSTGEVTVVEMVPQVPGQTAMGGDVQEEPKILKFFKQA